MNYLDQLDAHQQLLIWSNYTLIQKKPVFFKLIWNESSIQAFIPPMCFPGFLNHHKFRTNQKHLVIIRPIGSPKEPWLTSLETVASSCGKKDHGCLWCFSVPPKKEVQKKGSKLKPPKKGYTPLTSGQKFLEPWCFASVFFWGMKPLQQRQLLTRTKHRCSQVKRKWDLCISLSPWKVFRSLFSYIAHFKKNLANTTMNQLYMCRCAIWGKKCFLESHPNMQSQHPIFLVRTANKHLSSSPFQHDQWLSI